MIASLRGESALGRLLIARDDRSCPRGRQAPNWCLEPDELPHCWRGRSIISFGFGFGFGLALRLVFASRFPASWVPPLFPGLGRGSVLVVFLTLPSVHFHDSMNSTE